MRKVIHAGAAAVAMLAAGSASAATVRYDCHQPGKTPTYLDIDFVAKTMLVAEAAGSTGTDFKRQPVCAAFVQIIRGGTGDQADSYIKPARCTVAFSATAAVADYISMTPPNDFAMTIAFDASASTMTTIVRISTTHTLVGTLPCTRL
jgi:hypothetical protein